MFKFPKSWRSPSGIRRIERRAVYVTLAVLIGLLMAAGLALWQNADDADRTHDLQTRAEAFQPGQPVPPQGATIGGPFTLTSMDGQTVHDTDYRGKYMLIYFGYTYCPDMCPTGLQGVAHILDQLGPDAAKVAALFITIDPTRDTPEKMKEYSMSFHPQIVGLTGTPQQIADVAKAYQTYYAKGEKVDENDYLMDHSSLIYVMDDQGKFVGAFDETADPLKIIHVLREAWEKSKQL